MLKNGWDRPVCDPLNNEDKVRSVAEYLQKAALRRRSSR
jgi:hypothetical protein